MTITRLLIPSLLIAFACGCERHHHSSSVASAPAVAAPSYQFCAQSMSQAEVLEFLSRTYVIDSGVEDGAVKSSQLISDLALSMAVNGLNFTDLAGYNLTFANDTYSAVNGDRSISFKLTFAADFAPYHMGDSIPFNLFSLDSYVQNVNVATDGTYSLTPGPGYGLLSSAPPTTGRGLALTTFRPTLKTDLISFSVKSTNDYPDHVAFSTALEPDGHLTIQMTTTAATVSAVASQIQAQGFGFSYDGTSYQRPIAGLTQTFSNSTFLIQQDSAGAFWNGTYQSQITRGPLLLYLAGVASQRLTNYSDYFCDAAHQQKVGRLTWASGTTTEGQVYGTFNFADGSPDVQATR